ncbi:hypothetical protein CUMW_226570, partial [Citrus unshiu]
MIPRSYSSFNNLHAQSSKDHEITTMTKWIFWKHQLWEISTIHIRIQHSYIFIGKTEFERAASSETSDDVPSFKVLFFWSLSWISCYRAILPVLFI